VVPEVRRGPMPASRPAIPTPRCFRLAVLCFQARSAPRRPRLGPWLTSFASF